MNCYILSLWRFIVLLNHEYDNLYLFYLEWYAWWQILYPVVALLEVDYSNSQWMNGESQTAYFPTAHISVAIITVLAHWTSNICVVTINVTAHLKAVLHTQYSCNLMTIYTLNVTYLSPVVYWISDWQFEKEFQTSATLLLLLLLLLLHIIWVWLPLQNFHIFWSSIIVHPPLQLSNSHSTCCSSLVEWHTCHVTRTFIDCKKLRCMILWDGI